MLTAKRTLFRSGGSILTSSTTLPVRIYAFSRRIKNQPNERLVYLALNNVFRGTDAQLRKNKKIRKLILKHQEDINVRGLIHIHNLDNLYNVTRILLKQ